MHPPPQAEIQWSIWQRFSSETRSSESQFAYWQLAFLLDTIERLADLDDGVDSRIRSEMAGWLSGCTDYGDAESRIYEILATQSGAVDGGWTTQYLNFLVENVDYIHANSERIGAALRGAQAGAEENAEGEGVLSELADWWAGAKTKVARSKVELFMGDDIIGTSPDCASDGEVIVGHRRAELLLHVMQLLCPDVFWDDGGWLWCPRLYLSTESALLDYPYFEKSNIDHLVQCRFISGAEAEDLTRFAEAARSGVGAGEGFESSAVELRRALENTIEPDGLLQTLLNLRRIIINLRRPT